MKIAIVDDDVVFLDFFKHYLDEYLPNYFNEYKIYDINSNFLKKLLNEQYDIIFIDIDLQSEKGIDVVSIIKKIYSNCIFIFVSSKKEMVFDALSVQPFQFIRKSNLLEDLLLTLSLLNNYYKNNEKLITLEFYGRKTCINIKDIVYVQSDYHEINIVTINDSYTYRSTLKNMLNLMNSKSIIQIQKSLAINFDYVKEVNEKYDVILKNDNIFTINRYYRKTFMQKYKEYLVL